MMTAPAHQSNLLRRLYAWTLHWANTPYALPALCLLSFAESSFFPIPPDVLLAPICLTQPKRWHFYAFWCTVASVLGGILGWVIGHFLWQWTSSFFFHYIPGFSQEKFNEVGAQYQKFAFGFIILKGLVFIIPYKLVTITAGVFNVSLTTLISASIICRASRFYLVAGVIRYYGDKGQEFLEKHLEAVLLITLALLVLGFVSVNFFLHLMPSKN